MRPRTAGIVAGEIRMAYNPLGLSSQGPTSATSQATWFTRDPEGTLLAMLNTKTSEPDLYYLFDGLGSVAATADASGNLVRRYAYEPYGEEIDRSATDANPWRYASGYYDQQTGMLKFGTRYYMPDLLRWTQRDPVMGKPNDPMTLNAYGYVGGDTVTTDPSGRFFHDEVGQFLEGAAEGLLAAGPVAYVAPTIASGIGTLVCGPLCGFIALRCGPVHGTSFSAGIRCESRHGERVGGALNLSIRS